jgi:hypothetical protein
MGWQSIDRHRFAWWQSWLAFLFPKARKTHDYTQFQANCEYVFEPIENGDRGYMTGQGKGLRRGDYLMIGDRNQPARYEIEKIDYYSDQPDMWIASLKKLPDSFN